MSKPEIAVFDRQNPCTKVEIWNCFHGRTGFKRVQVDVAKSVIGANVPRVMEREGRLVVEKGKKEDLFILTPVGEVWLTEGIKRYLKNHPAEVADVKYPPKATIKKRRVRK